jgi:23S rRNA pseudouridine2604 synthase
MSEGVYLKELDVTTRPCVVERIGKRKFRIVLTQGLNRQIRRMCKEFGYHVQELKRVRIMNIRLGHLKTGTWRNVTEEELQELLYLLEESQMEESADE